MANLWVDCMIVIKKIFHYQEAFLLLKSKWIIELLCWYFSHIESQLMSSDGGRRKKKSIWVIDRIGNENEIVWLWWIWILMEISTAFLSLTLIFSTSLSHSLTSSSTRQIKKQSKYEKEVWKCVFIVDYDKCLYDLFLDMTTHKSILFECYSMWGVEGNDMKITFENFSRGDIFFIMNHWKCFKFWIYFPLYLIFMKFELFFFFGKFQVLKNSE